MNEILFTGIAFYADLEIKELSKEKGKAWVFFEIFQKNISHLEKDMVVIAIPMH